ncbi:hypothetical protein D9M71_195930 [compost metagenome]
MSLQVFRVLRCTSQGQICRAGIQVALVGPKRVADQLARLREGTAHHEIEFTLQRVKGFVAVLHVQGHLRVAAGKLGKHLR